MILQPKNKKLSHGSLPILIAIFVMALILVAVIATAAVFVGDRTGAGTGMDGNSLGGVDCSGVATLTPDQYQWVKDAAGKYLGGDEAKLIALIQVESTWNPQATNPSSASGLGQFVNSTARGYPEFVSGDDKHGTVWPAGQIYDDPASHPDDARFDAHRSIYASAHLLSGKIAQYGSFGDAYEKGYHGGSTPDQIQAAKEARVKLEKIYQTLTAGGGCKSTVIAGVLDVPLILQKLDGYCGRASMVMTIAYWHKENLTQYQNLGFQDSIGQISADKVRANTGKPYQLSNSIDTAIASIQKGNPVIAYTGLYNNQHIIVLTGYDSSSQTFYANDPYPSNNGSKNVQKIGSVTLTRANMVVTTSLGAGIYGHAPFILIP